MTMTNTTLSPPNYKVVAPISITFALTGMFLCFIILILVTLTKRLHTVTYLLICNTCVSSILYCIVQCNNYIYLLFITWDTSDRSCQWRGYFNYMSIAAVIYSYLIQAISRLFFSILSTKYRWLRSLKTHLSLIVIEWMIAIVVPLPSLVTKDIYFRPGFLCWVSMRSMLHVGYTVLTYYLIPTVLIVTIYIIIYVQMRRNGNNTCIQKKTTKRKQNREFEVLRNIMILFGIYISDGIPTGLFILTRIDFFYLAGLVSITLGVTIEKTVSILIDREIRNIFKHFFVIRHGNPSEGTHQ